MDLDQKAIREILGKDDPVVLELGAHTGIDSKRFLDQFSGIRIYCFEPDLRCIRAFKNRISDERCVLVEAAVSNNDGETRLNVSTGWPAHQIPRLVRALRFGRLYVWW